MKTVTSTVYLNDYQTLVSRYRHFLRNENSSALLLTACIRIHNFNKSSKHANVIDSWVLYAIVMKSKINSITSS